MELRIKVGDVMTKNFVSVHPDTNLLKCAKEMIKKKTGSLILSKDNGLTGILTRRDIIWAITKKPNLDLKIIKAGDIATKKLITIRPSADIEEAMHKMKKFKFRRLPVISGGKVIGILTLKDILKMSPRLIESVEEIIHIKEESEKLKRKSEILKQSGFREGMCEECGNFDILSKIDNRNLCEACRDAM